MKRKIWGLLLVFAVVLTTVNLPEYTAAANEKDPSGVQVKVTGKEENNSTDDSGSLRSVRVTAENNLETEALLQVHVLDETGEGPAEDVEAVNLCEEADITDPELESSLEDTLKTALTLQDGTISAMDAKWVEEKDDAGNVTARYLEGTLPAGASAAFDLQLLYRADEETYSKKVIVQARAFVGEQDVTVASDEEDEDSEVEVTWESAAAETVSESSQAAGLNSAAALSADLNEGYIYLDPTGMSEKWTGDNVSVYLILIGASNWSQTAYLMSRDETNGYWECDISQWTNTNGIKFLFAISNDWNVIKSGDYKRTSVSENTIEEIQNGSKTGIYSWDDPNTEEIDNHLAYCLKEGAAFHADDHTFFAGETMWFENKSGTDINSVTAVFYEKGAEGDYTEVGRIPMTDRENNQFSVTIPSGACSYVQFLDSTGVVLGATYSNFYGQGTDEEGTESFVFDTSDAYCYLYSGNVDNSTWGARTVTNLIIYFDASLSKLSYKGTVDDGDIGLPNSIGNVFYHAFSSVDTSVYKDGTMTLVSGSSDVYEVTLDKQYDSILFYTGSSQGDYPEIDSPCRTVDLKIDWSKGSPCFFADDSDDIAYTTSARSGYWGEYGSVRDAESGKGTDVVDISQETFEKASNTMYVNSTFYDYYTDYELNGFNRDSYGGENGASQRNWVNFRQFDQALSDYYENANAAIPIYTGQFQPSINGWGNWFADIAGTLNLFGYDSNNQNPFMSTNNSTLDLYGNQDKYDDAAQGLVASSLQDGNLMLSDGSDTEPHFDTAFLSGENSKGTKLGEVYENVSFPFTKKDVHNDGVEYWCFDSAETTLAMKQDPDTGQYYLKDTGNQDWAKNVNSSGTTDTTAGKISTTYGFFPFNETSAAASGKNYNYGFGTKIEFTFRLTDDGYVLNSDEEKVPITFEFSGDDDVWVFIDGQLALDVGGAHGRATGSIDFSGEGTTKTSTVSSVKASQGSTKAGTDVKSTFEITGSNTTEHTLTMFYMERGMWESNMKITFNFPDENLFEVEKQVDTSDVNTDIFDESMFTDADSFGFTIKNAATHWTSKGVINDDAQPLMFNTDFSERTIEAAAEQNTFRKVDSMAGHDNVVYWYALYEDDASGTYRDSRWGIITPSGGGTVDASEYEYFSFDFYFDENRIPSLNNMWVELEDSSGNTCGGKLTSQNTYGSSNLSAKTWETIRVYLSRLDKEDGFDFSSVAKVKIAFRYPRSIYLDNIQFVPATSMEVMTGFTVQQSEIPDYGSVDANQTESPSLQEAEGAVYTVTNENTGEVTYGRIGSNGEFSLGDGDTASFSNQFRLGSYIYLEETGVNSTAFTTSWTLYDDGVEVDSISEGSTDTVTTAQDTVLSGVQGTALEDNRTEKTDVNSGDANYTVEKDTSEPSIVFRSYTDPDSRAAATKLKAVVVNKVNTGSITIQKEKAGNSPELAEDAVYTFKITFTNVAGSALESNPVEYEMQLKYGESKTITGIPLGTEYVIEEIGATDGSRLESIVLPDNNSYVELDGNKVHGLLMDAADSTLTTFVFKNTTRPQIDISVEKAWRDGNGDDISGLVSTDIYIRLERKYTESDGTDHPFETVRYGDQDYIKVSKGYEGWVYSFTGLEKYQDDACTIPYTYRVVEGYLDDDGNFVPTENGKIIVADGQEYTVTYNCIETTDGVSDPEEKTEMTGSNAQTESQSFHETIINSIRYRTDLKIVKVDASDIETKLAGVEFTIEKGTADSTAEGFTPDPEFGENGVHTIITGDGTGGNTQGEALLPELEDGLYRITETKAASGYSLLKSPVYLKIDRTNGCTVQDGDSQEQSISVDKDTVTLRISNRLLFELPATGGYLRFYMIAGGLALAGLALFIYRMQKNRKEASSPGRKRKKQS